MPEGFTNEKSVLPKVMVWWRYATSDYLSQRWPRPVSTYKPQWANVCNFTPKTIFPHTLLRCRWLVLRWPMFVFPRPLPVIRLRPNYQHICIHPQSMYFFYKNPLRFKTGMNVIGKISIQRERVYVWDSRQGANITVGVPWWVINTHYDDVMMGAIASQITSLTIVYSTGCLFSRRSNKTSKFRVTGLCEGNSPATGEFPAQRASNAENVSIWWRHHETIRSQLLAKEKCTTVEGKGIFWS